MDGNVCARVADGGGAWASTAAPGSPRQQREPAGPGGGSEHQPDRRTVMPAASAGGSRGKGRIPSRGSVQDLGIKVLQAAQTVADRTGFENTGAGSTAVDGAIGEVMYDKFKEFDEQFLQPVFGGGERSPSTPHEGVHEAVQDATTQVAVEEGVDVDGQHRVLGDTVSHAV